MNSTILPVEVEAALADLPQSILGRSGSVFYSGWQSLQKPSALYLIGLNPGGNPVEQSQNTVARHIAEFRERTQPWSAYVDERWESAKPGAWGMQPRIQHLFRSLDADVDPRLVPASNVVFVRTRNEADLKTQKRELMNACWPVHKAVIEALETRVVLCLGKTSGLWVRERLEAHKEIDKLTECNRRRWSSYSHEAADGRIVVTLTHPSRADWRNPAADPSPLIKRALQRTDSKL